jgi:hypothetical protein
LLFSSKYSKKNHFYAFPHFDPENPKFYRPGANLSERAGFALYLDMEEFHTPHASSL